MLQGYVNLYTNRNGLLNYLSCGICEARIEQNGIFNYQIVVPIQAVEYDLNSESKFMLREIVDVDITKE